MGVDRGASCRGTVRVGRRQRLASPVSLPMGERAGGGGGDEGMGLDFISETSSKTRFPKSIPLQICQLMRIVKNK
jgi:hypothetical protein